MKRQREASLAILVAASLSVGVATAKSRGDRTSPADSVKVTAAAREYENAGSTRNEIEWIKIMPSERLVDQDVVSGDGRTLGRISSIMLDAANGDVVYVVVSAGADFLAVPFGALELRGRRGGDPIRVAQTYKEVLKNSPRASDDQAKGFADAGKIVRTNRAFGIATPYGYVVPPNPDREQHPNRYLLVRPRNMGVVERETNASERNQARAQDIIGREVLRANGEPVGKVDYVMLDVEAGRIAYLLLSSGDFLGLGGEWIPVPPEAIAWPPDKQVPILKDRVKRGALEPLQRSELPNFVRRSELEALYDRFNIPIYQLQSRVD